MSSSHDISSDPVERALGLLRREHSSPAPDAELEAKLRSRFDGQTSSGNRTRRLLVTVVTAGLLSGAAFAATGGFSWLRAWWYSVQVDGQTETGTVDRDGRRVFSFETENGGSAEVRISRDRLGDDATRTRIELDREENGDVEEERVEDVFGERTRIFLPSTHVDGYEPLYEGMDSSERRFELYVLPHSASSDDAGPSLYLLRPHLAPQGVEEIGRAPQWLLVHGTRATFNDLEEGSLAIRYLDGQGGEFELVLSLGGVEEGEPGVSELETPDGRVRVRVEELPRRAER